MKLRRKRKPATPVRVPVRLDGYDVECLQKAMRAMAKMTHDTGVVVYRGNLSVSHADIAFAFEGLDESYVIEWTS